MAEDERALEGYHYWGAVSCGFLGSLLLWLAIGESLLVQVLWVPIAVAVASGSWGGPLCRGTGPRRGAPAARGARLA
jgi:hypothetical protein